MKLNRKEFKEQVFKRDNYKCVVCNKPAVDAHHIIDRSLFADGGYVLDNGVSLCSNCHIKAEQTVLSCSELRQKANIINTIYPSYLGLNEFVVDYDKWGNPILKNGQRLKGYIFKQENVQKIIKPLHLFEKEERLVDKYPRTYHLPISPGTTSDDRISKNINNLIGREIVISEKLDGENQSIQNENKYNCGIYARSRVAPTVNKWSSWFKPKFDLIKQDLRDFKFEFCFENMYAEHSIIYSKLNAYEQVFGIKDIKRDIFLSWTETEYYSELFDMNVVPVLYKGIADSIDELNNLIGKFMNEPSILNDDNIWTTPKEGVVCRITDEFPADMFYNSVFKYVRKGHVQTDKHWSKNWKKAKLHSELIKYNKNKLKQIYKDQINNKQITF